MSVIGDCIECIERTVATALEGETCYVSVGGSTVQRQDEFIVRELPESVTFSDRTTSTMGRTGAHGLYRVDFNVAFDVWCKRPTVTAASSLVLEWVERAYAAVACDKTLGGLAVHAQPYMDNGGTALDTNKTAIAAINCGIHVTAEIYPADQTKD